MKKNISKKPDCCGCTACYHSCPKQAITMVKDERGLFYPIIDEGKCINCNICVKVCPFKKEIKAKESQKVYAVKNKNISTRMSSSSGGFFCALAQHVVKNNGVVCGAIYDENLNVVHSIIDNESDIHLLQTSKYVQSDLNNVYVKIKEYLKKGTLVLFSGTPCQVYGLICFLNKKYDNLITCDLVCHGVPSVKIFDDHKHYLEKKQNSKIKNMNFRFKDDTAVAKLKIDFENDTFVIEKQTENYFFLFQRNYILRECCYECHFANMNRISDITMGDYWGLEKSYPDFYDKHGVSMIMLNTNNGEKIFNKIKDEFMYIETDIETCKQPNLLKPTAKPNGYNFFWKCYNKIGYINSVRVIKMYYYGLKAKNKIFKCLKRGDKNV